MRRYVIIVLILAIGYLIGAKYPVIAQQVGLA